MAQAKLNPSFQHIRGQIGDLVYKHYGDKVVVTRVPRFSGKWSKAQVAARRRFKLASEYAQKVAADPKKLADYARVAEKRGLTARAVACADFLKAPTIDEIDTSAYAGRVGDRIGVLANDDFEVVTVEVAIRDPRGNTIEQGQAQKKANRWTYVASAAAPRGQTTTIEVTAADRPGNKTVKQG